MKLVDKSRGSFCEKRLAQSLYLHQNEVGGMRELRQEDFVLMTSSDFLFFFFFLLFCPLSLDNCGILVLFFFSLTTLF